MGTEISELSDGIGNILALVLDGAMGSIVLHAENKMS
jgi:hypothetical protein